ncbi:hypothetical protein [Archangium violaceum]
MSSLLEEISRKHFPYPPATPEEIEVFEPVHGLLARAPGLRV